MHSRQLTTGRTFGIRFDPGESFFFPAGRILRRPWHPLRYIPMFLAAFAEAEIVGTCDKLDDPAAPVWTRVQLTNAKALGCGTIAYNVHQLPAAGRPPITGVGT